MHEKISKEMKTTVEAIAYIAEHMKREMSLKKVKFCFSCHLNSSFSDARWLEVRGNGVG